MVNWKKFMADAGEIAQEIYESKKNGSSGRTDKDDDDNDEANAAVSKLDDGSNIPLSTCTGTKKSLFVGINYIGSKAELRGCINDVKNIKKFVVEHYKFPQDTEHMKTLTDDGSGDDKPTKDNMITAMKWLVTGAKSGDSLFFHYSGHGGSQDDDDGDEKNSDGKDETLIPVDYETAGVLVDEDLHDILVKGLPQGVRLTVITDCCHSGSALDLPYTYNIDGATNQIVETDNRKAVIQAALKMGMSLFQGRKEDALEAGMQALKLHFAPKGASSGSNSSGPSANELELRQTVADVIQFSGCRDDQTSADASIGGTATGAMSWSFIEAFNKYGQDQTYVELLGNIRTLLQGKYQQIPQMATGHRMDMNQPFKM